MRKICQKKHLRTYHHLHLWMSVCKAMGECGGLSLRERGNLLRIFTESGKRPLTHIGYPAPPLPKGPAAAPGVVMIRAHGTLRGGRGGNGKEGGGMFLMNS